MPIATADRPNTPSPSSHILSNGRYTVLLTDAGTGYSAWYGYALTRWSGDPIEDGDGLFIYLRDLDGGAPWSLGRQPIAGRPDNSACHSQPGQVEITRTHDGIEARMAVCVAPDADVEIRRVTLRNASARARRLELTSHAEVVLNWPGADAAHPAFSKLFVQTEAAPDRATLLARRRPRSAHEEPLWMACSLSGPGALQYETDRARFVGRGRSPAAPLALTTTAPLSATVGNVLDPVLSLRRVVELEAGGQAEFVLAMTAALDRETVLRTASQFAHDPVDEVFAQAGARERHTLDRLDIDTDRAGYWQRFAGAVLYGWPGLRAAPAVLGRARGPLARLDRHGLPLYLPVVLFDPVSPAQHELLDDLLKAQAYWRTFGLQTALIILDDEADTLARRAGEPAPDGVHCRRASALPPADRDLLHALARCVVTEALPTLGETVVASTETDRYAPVAFAQTDQSTPSAPETLRHFNGYGGFNADGDEYVIRLAPTANGDLNRPPLPWINVIANEAAGFLVSESGAGYTWSRNSREHRLTPWYNDPIADPHGEAFYIRDEDAGTFWSPVPGPLPQAVNYETRHGFGYSRFSQRSQDLHHDVRLFVPRHDPIKIVQLRLTNHASSTRRLALFAYQRLILGVLPADSGRFAITEHDATASALLAWNPCSEDFADGVAFAAVVAPAGAELNFTGDRAAFVGARGHPARPAALIGAAPLDRRVGAGLDPCLAWQVGVTLAPGATLECAFLLGEAEDRNTVAELVARYRRPGAVAAALDDARTFWRRTLTAVRVETPEPAIDLMLNGWLAYQNLACRLWARSAFYQSGGAYGFRDQLQDSAALVYLRPDLTRAQILLHAAHQFGEGDVLHWWHPPRSRGIRTRFSDDLLWLPYVTAFYGQTTGDWGILDESAGFLSARPLAEGEDETYLQPTDSGETATIYEHCCRTLDRSLTRGAHGLPLMGTGDWNDGMNRVGREGRGESVWLGFFLYAVLGDFIPLCERRGDGERARRYRDYRSALATALDTAGWDGAWYRRAYYDDGTPLGSAANDECQIDALAQAWAVISGVAPPDRAARAMDAAEQRLIDEAGGLIRLLAPPFDKTAHDPGYIKGYVAGVRENGGQYTHAACWVVRALAELGRNDRAARLLTLLSPVSHARTVEDTAVYQVEPYVVAADVYGVSPHVGRGGWTWYTGSAGWFYRVALESVLGCRLVEGHTLRIAPRVPDDWPGFRVDIRLADGLTVYRVQVDNPSGKARTVLNAAGDDGAIRVEDGAAWVSLSQDGATHTVRVTLGDGAPPA